MNMMKLFFRSCPVLNVETQYFFSLGFVWTVPQTLSGEQFQKDLVPLSGLTKSVVLIVCTRKK